MGIFHTNKYYASRGIGFGFGFKNIDFFGFWQLGKKSYILKNLFS